MTTPSFAAHDPERGDASSQQACFDALFAGLATEQERRRLWKRLAAALHPDRNAGDPNATARFRAAREAYRRAEGRAAAGAASRAAAATPTATPPAPTAPVPGGASAGPGFSCPACQEPWSFPLPCPRCDVDPRNPGPALAAREAEVAAWIEAVRRPSRVVWPSEPAFRRAAGATLAGLVVLQLAAGLFAPAGFTLFGLTALSLLMAAEGLAARRTRRWQAAGHGPS